MPSCPVCYEDYTSTDDHCPYVLPCGHSLCFQCMNALNFCPLCKTEYSFNDVKKNYSLLEIIQQQQQQQQQGPQGPYSGTHPFFIALFNSPISAVQYISCPNINIKDEEGNSLLHVAASLNSTEITQHLLDKGIDCSLLNSQGMTALHLAVKNQSFAVAHLLLESRHDLINIKDSFRVIPLIRAIQLDSVDSVKVFLDADPNQLSLLDEQHSSFLHIAAQFNSVEVSKFLISKGININSQDAFGNTPLHISILNHSLIIAEFLISNGADLSLSNISGLTPIHLAAKMNYVELVKLLISKGVDINFQDQSEFKFTPLHFASLYNCTDVLNYLISSSADQSIQDQYFGLNASELASSHHFIFNTSMISSSSQEYDNNQVVNLANIPSAPILNIHSNTLFQINQQNLIHCDLRCIFIIFLILSAKELDDTDIFMLNDSLSLNSSLRSLDLGSILLFDI